MSISIKNLWEIFSVPLGRSCLLERFPSEGHPALVAHLVSARASLTPRCAKASAAPALPSQGMVPARVYRDARIVLNVELGRNAAAALTGSGW